MNKKQLLEKLMELLLTFLKIFAKKTPRRILEGTPRESQTAFRNFKRNFGSSLETTEVAPEETTENVAVISKRILVKMWTRIFREISSKISKGSSREILVDFFWEYLKQLLQEVPQLLQ